MRCRAEASSSILASVRPVRKRAGQETSRAVAVLEGRDTMRDRVRPGGDHFLPPSENGTTK
jgi:hypothetical protein